MGGRGSGDWQNGRPTTAGRVRLDVRAAVRAGLDLAAPGAAIAASWPGGDAAALRLEAIAGEDGRATAVVVTSGGRHVETLDVAWTRAGYGRRPWWHCPACGCRAAILYGAGRWTLAPLRCRRCHALAYASSRQNAEQRADAALRRALAALGATTGEGWAVVNVRDSYTPPRPPGMRRSTYARRLAAYRCAYDAAGDAWIAAFMGSATTRRMLAASHAHAP